MKIRQRGPLQGSSPPLLFLSQQELNKLNNASSSGPRTAAVTQKSTFLLM